MKEINYKEKTLNQIYIPSKLYREGRLARDKMATYIMLHALAYNNKPFDKHVVSATDICYYMLGNFDFKSVMISTVNVALNSLIEDGDIIGEKHGRNYIIDSSNFIHNKGEYFSAVYLEDVLTILRSNIKNKFDIVEYYVWVMGSRKNKIGFLTMKYFETKLNKARNTIISYNRILEDLNILYIKHSWGGGKDDEGNYTGESNKYCHYIDRALLYSPDSDNGEATREHKSLGAKYAQMIKGKRYSDTEEYKIYKYIKDLNDEERKKSESCPAYIPKYLDMSIFSFSNT